MLFLPLLLSPSSGAPPRSRSRSSFGCMSVKVLEDPEDMGRTFWEDVYRKSGVPAFDHDILEELGAVKRDPWDVLFDRAVRENFIDVGKTQESEERHKEAFKSVSRSTRDHPYRRSANSRVSASRGSSSLSGLWSAPTPCPALQKCKEAGIVVKNPSFAAQIWRLHQTLQRLPEKYKVTEDVPGDGDCFFHANIRRIHEQRPWMPPHLLTPKRMRQETVKALKRDDIKEEVRGFLEIEGNPGEQEFETRYEAHLKQASGSMWADHVMSSVLSRLYGVDLTVVHDDGYVARIDAVSDLAPSLHILDEIVKANKGAVPAPVKAELGNFSQLHFVLIEKDDGGGGGARGAEGGRGEGRGEERGERR